MLVDTRLAPRASLTFETFRLIVNANITVELFGFFWVLFAVAATISRRCGLMLARNPLVRLDVGARSFGNFFVFCGRARWGWRNRGQAAENQENGVDSVRARNLPSSQQPSRLLAG
jgi:hypothetical protein